MIGQDGFHSDNLHNTQISLPFEKLDSDNHKRRTEFSKNVSLGDPAVSVIITEFGTYIVPFENIWQAAKQYAERHGYNVIETYGVIGVAPFYEEAIGAWLTYLQVPFKLPIEIYQLGGEDSPWLAEWSI